MELALASATFFTFGNPLTPTVYAVANGLHAGGGAGLDRGVLTGKVAAMESWRQLVYGRLKVGEGVWTVGS